MRRNLRNLRFTHILFFMLPALLIAQPGTKNAGKDFIETKNQIVNTEIMLPMGVAEDSIWLHYDDVDNFDSWGFLISGEEYDVVAKWDPGDISNYDEWTITKIKFIVVSNMPYLKVKVWEGSGFTEIYSQDVDTYNVNSWTEVELDTPVTIDGSQELYVGYNVDMTHTELGGFVTATDDGPPIDEYGNLVWWNGGWYSDFNNHNLQVFIKSVLNADFEADNTVICAGGTVNFTDLSTNADTYNWTFEGGTPSTSTDENPAVTYSTPGTYDVTLEVSDDSDTDSETKTDYITVIDVPAMADMPLGEENVCTGEYLLYATNPVLYGQNYEWEVDPVDAGTLTPNDTSAQLQVSEDWTGDFTIKVRATNMCGNGEWSDEMEGTVYQSPDAFNLQGGGGYCLGGDGMEITLDGSQTDVDYELYLDGEATGNIVAGTGSAISFGLITEEGYYTCIGSNDNCDLTMNEQIQVFLMFPPLEPATPEGPEVVCDEISSDYTSEGSDDADSYEWELSPEEAGIITANGLEANVEWNTEFMGTAYISLYGTNQCGDGNSSTALEVNVGSPNPEIEGELLVCDWSDEIYEVAENEGSTYTWEVTGGTISEGQGSYMITVSWSGEGNGTLNVVEETAGGCEGSAEEVNVTIDDCTGIDESETTMHVYLFPNPVEGNKLQIKVAAYHESYVIKIIDLSGRKLYESVENRPTIQIDISDLTNSVYSLLVEDEKNQVLVSKFIKR